MDFKDSWDATKNHKLMMFTAVVIFPTALIILEYCLSLIPGLSYLGDLLSIVTAVFIVATLSVAYKIVMDSQIVR